MVRIEGSRVAIVGPDGSEALTRTWASEDEAATFASTVRQHLRWLSEERFREYYRLDLVSGAEGSLEET